MHLNKRISNRKLFGGIFLSILALIIAQVVAMSITVFGAVFSAILYIIFAFLLIFLLCHKVLKINLTDIRILPFKVKGIWIASAIILPTIVLLFLIFSGGEWKTANVSTIQMLKVLFTSIICYGIAPAIVEEMVFRGVIMSLLENKFNRFIAIVCPSILFGALHTIGNPMNVLSFIQLLVAGTLVGILFSLIAVESGSIWNSAIVHGLWNTVFIGSIMHIGNDNSAHAIFSYELISHSFIITGGDFGIEASLPAIIGYIIFIIFAYYRINKYGNEI
ncbi:CPBP family intramembrane glutamic endopeptidase [Macrococcus capreoli]|uniref:CPBP family intramembrane glutamic endopeptidase n=1 Tax=Macrococcus capreoli TaxID=2982690 RepID=UPI003EE69EEA